MNLKELSSALGLSQTTVSRALNGYPEVSEATRLRVQAAAQQHDYRPNLRAKSLATGRSMAIGHVLTTTSRHEVVNPIFADFIAGAGETYTANSYEMILTVVDDSSEADVYKSLKARGAVEGVILHGPTMNDPRIALLHDMGLPFAVHGRATESQLPYCWLDVNNRSSFRRATDFLADLGHSRIALINGLENMDFAHRRRGGYHDALDAHGLTADPALMYSGEMTEANGYRQASAMLRRPRPPTAFLASSMISGLGVKRAIEDSGLVTGKDVSVIVHDDMLSYLANSGDVPLFTAMRSPVRDAGRLLAAMLIDRIQNPNAPPKNILLEAELIIGRSTGPLRRDSPLT